VTVIFGIRGESCDSGLTPDLVGIPYVVLDLLRFGIIPTILGVITRVVSIVRAAIPLWESYPEASSPPERIRRITWPSA
jgi:bacteriorhodopsin